MENKWNNVSESLPNDFVKVNVYDKTHQNITCAYKCGSQWFFDDGTVFDIDYCGVRIWVQIPNVPKVEK